MSGQIDMFGDYVRGRLEHWGREFALHRDCEYLGHCSKNILQVLIEHRGEMPAPNVGYKPLETDYKAQQIEDIIVGIARANLAMALCMRGYYCGKGRKRVERWETANLLLANAGEAVIRSTAYIELVRRGEERVRGVLEGIALAA